MPAKDEVLERQFVSIGARARFVSPGANSVSFNVRRDRRGEYFELGFSATALPSILNTDRRRRHLLLLVSVDGQKSRFLCGHDERHWFVAAIPEDERGVVNVAAARRALRRQVCARPRASCEIVNGVVAGILFSCARASGSSSPRPTSRRQPGMCGATSRSVAAEANRTSWSSLIARAGQWCSGVANIQTI